MTTATDVSQPQAGPRLKLAIQKSGRLSERSGNLLSACGLDFTRSKDKLFWYGKNLPVDLLLVRDDDIPQLLLDGVCDLGIVGQNVARETELARPGDGSDSRLKTLRELGFGHCRLCLAIPESKDFASLGDIAGQRIATSYPNLVREYLDRHQVQAAITRLSGSVEIAPSVGTADCIVDLVSTGSTLRANHLREVECLLESEAVLYQRPGELPNSLQILLDRLLLRLDGVLQVNESKYVMLHAPREAVGRIADLLPGAERPTVLPLEGTSDRVAVHAVCRESLFWEHLESLKAAGASAILVLPVEKMLA